jgi:hypothetical protein
VFCSVYFNFLIQAEAKAVAPRVKTTKLAGLHLRQAFSISRSDFHQQIDNDSAFDAPL